MSEWILIVITLAWCAICWFISAIFLVIRLYLAGGNIGACAVSVVHTGSGIVFGHGFTGEVGRHNAQLPTCSSSF